MLIHFDREPAIRDVIELRRREIFSELEDLLPLAEIEHVGSTAVRGGWTSGEVDIQVRVEQAQLEEAARELGERFQRKEGPVEEDVAVFKLEGRGVTIILTVQDGPRDVHHKHRDRLRDQPLLRERYDALKRKHQDGDADAYRAAKDAFFAELSSEPPAE
jgi:GrpB-like predicted nucleotidyltransferase (UPF0157 family)